MNELQRQRYLSALGIDSFVPRLILPWAQPSVPCELPQPQVASMPTPAVNESASATPAAEPVASLQDGAEVVGQVLRDMGVAKPTAVRKEPLKAALPKRRELLETVHLHLWRPVDDLIVVDHYQPGAALPTDKLLHNILRLLWRSDVRVDAGEAIRCPISDKVASLYTRDDMRVELQAWFSEELQKTPTAQVWLLGAEAAKYLVGTSADAVNTDVADTANVAADVNSKPPADNNGQDTAPELLHFKRVPLATDAAPLALVLPSLTEMLNEPELKNKLWLAVHKSD